jgi:hypothetical protein
MPPYYADINKDRLHARNLFYESEDDPKAGQTIKVTGSPFGIMVEAPKRWSPLCQKFFVQKKANGISLGNVFHPWKSSVAFINDMPECRNLSVNYVGPVDFSALAGNPNLEGLELEPLDPDQKPGEFDISSLPNLRRCQVILSPGFDSVFKCKNLVSLSLQGGKHEGILMLDGLPALEEFICREVKKIKGVTLSPDAKLRSLDLTNLKLFEDIRPIKSVVEKLLVVCLQRLPRMKIEWLAQAKNCECISLGLKIPTIAFLKDLKQLQVLSLFGSKVEDRNFSVRDALAGELDARPWGGR